MKKIIRFTASWCQPCKALKSTLDLIDLKMPIEVVDIDENSDMAIKYSVRSVPTMVMIQDETEKTRLVGLHPADRIVEWAAQ